MAEFNSVVSGSKLVVTCSVPARFPDSASKMGVTLIAAGSDQLSVDVSSSVGVVTRNSDGISDYKFEINLAALTGVMGKPGYIQCVARNAAGTKGRVQGVTGTFNR